MDLEVEKLLRRSSENELREARTTLDSKYREEFERLCQEERQRIKNALPKAFDPTPFVRMN